MLRQHRQKQNRYLLIFFGGIGAFVFLLFIIAQSSQPAETFDSVENVDTAPPKPIDPKEYQRLRMEYAKILAKEAWIEDIDVEISGKKSDVLTITGSHFAANRNIQAFQDGIHEAMVRLRFKESRYKWYKESDEYTSYTIDPLPK